MSNNVNPATASSQTEVVLIDKRVELAIYDALPRRWRVLVDSLPVSQGMVKIAEYREKLGDDEAYARVVRAFRTQFVGWLPPGDDYDPPCKSRGSRVYGSHGQPHASLAEAAVASPEDGER